MENGLFESYGLFNNNYNGSLKECKNASVRIPECINDDFCLSVPRNRNDGILTMAFVDMQPLESVYPENTAFCNGSLFPNITKPFLGRQFK